MRVRKKRRKRKGKEIIQTMEIFTQVNNLQEKK